MNKVFSGKVLIQLFVLGLSWTLIYSLGFIQYLLYDPFQKTLGCTNTQLGILMTIFGLGNVLGAPVGGWLADRFDYRKIFVCSLLGNGILSLIFSFHMTYNFAFLQNLQMKLQGCVQLSLPSVLHPLSAHSLHGLS